MSRRPQQKLLSRAIIASVTLSTYGMSLHAYAERALEEVIVTAQKKDDTLQTVPMTVNAVTSETIAKFNLLDFKDIQSVTPGLNIAPVDTRTASVAMRGVNVLTDSGFDPSVAIYWNEVPYDIDTAFKGMYDIGQIEVLRGPQGTLRGNTSPSGAITIVTKRPSYTEIEGTVEQTLGERSLSNTQVGLSLPIIEDRLALRVAGLYNHNENDGIKNIPTGKENKQAASSGRVTLALRATDKLDVTLIHQYLEADSYGSGISVGCGTGSSIKECLNASDRKSVVANPNDTTNRRAETALTLEWDLDKYTLTSITGYRDQHNFTSVPVDGGNVSPTAPGGASLGPLAQHVNTNLHTFTQEIRFASQDADFYNWTYGLAAQKNVTNTFVDQPSLSRLYLAFPGPFYVPIGYSTTPTVIAIPINSEGYGAFTNQSFQWTDKFETQVGVRYQSKRSTTQLVGDAGGNPIQFPAGGGTARNVGEGITGTASASYQLTDDIRVYANYGHAYRSGGFQVAPNTPGDLTEYKPEDSDSLELGFKSRLADGRVQFNGDIYYQKFHNFLAHTQQGIRTVDLVTHQTADNLLSYNADGEVSGAELQLDALLTDNWQAGLSVSYTDAKFTDGEAYCNQYDPVTGVVLNPPAGLEVNKCKAHGRLTGEPNWGVSANSEYIMHFGPVDGYVRGLYTFKSGSVDDSAAGSILDTSSYGVFNLFLGVRDPKKVWEVSVWAKNLFDHQQITSKGTAGSLSATGIALDPATFGFVGFVPDASNPPVASGYRGVSLIPERQIGITGKYNFSL